MKYFYVFIVVLLWLIIQWLTHDSYWFNFILNLITIFTLAYSNFQFYQQTKRKHFTRDEYKEAMHKALEKTNNSLLNDQEK